MAGTLVISTLSDGTNSTSSTNCIQGSAKAWCAYNGTGSSVRGSFNIGSVTKNGTGDYTYNFTTAMPSVNYACVVTPQRDQGNTLNQASWGIASYSTAITTTSIRAQFTGSTFSTLTDMSYANIVVFSA